MNGSVLPTDGGFQAYPENNGQAPQKDDKSP